MPLLSEETTRGQKNIPFLQIDVTIVKDFINLHSIEYPCNNNSCVVFWDRICIDLWWDAEIGRIVCIGRKQSILFSGSLSHGCSCTARKWAIQPTTSLPQLWTSLISLVSRYFSFCSLNSYSTALKCIMLFTSTICSGMFSHSHHKVKWCLCYY